MTGRRGRRSGRTLSQPGPFPSAGCPWLVAGRHCWHAPEGWPAWGETEAEEARTAIGEMIDAQTPASRNGCGRCCRNGPMRCTSGPTPVSGGPARNSSMIPRSPATATSRWSPTTCTFTSRLTWWVEGRGRFTNRSGGERPVRITSVLVRDQAGGRWRSRTLRSRSRTLTYSPSVRRWHNRAGAASCCGGVERRRHRWTGRLVADWPPVPAIAATLTPFPLPCRRAG